MFIFSLDGWSRLLPTRFLVSRRTQDTIRLPLAFIYGTCTLCGRSFNIVLLARFLPYHGPTTPTLRLVWAPPLSLAATQGITVVFFSSGYLDVSVPRVPLSQTICCHTITYDGFPHSDINGSSCTYHSPSRFAVCRVLLQFQVPRHPPYALIRLITAYFLVSLESVCLTFYSS